MNETIYSKDYRTWWRIIYENWIDGFIEDIWDGIQWDYEVNDRNTIDCMCEQMWAERMGLA